MISRHLLTVPLISLVAATAVMGADTAPTATRATAAPTTRQSRGGLNIEGPALKCYQLFPKASDLVDPEQRAAKGEQAIAILKPLVAELDQQPPATQKNFARSRDSFVAELIVLGDGDTRAAVERTAAGTGPDADRAKAILVNSKWLQAARDPAAQATMANDFERQAKSDPTNADLTMTVLTYSNTAASPELKKRLMDAAMGMDNRTVTAWKAQQAKANKIKLAEGKPMVLAGTTPEGKPFTTADWKGKVILVDFWAGWCGPCRAELPRVRKVYAEYHDKGFEVLGIDNDYTLAGVTAATRQEGLPWPQLYDAEAAANKKWNGITSRYGITGIPVMFLIDKQGICRTATARDDFETRIPQMLAE